MFLLASSMFGLEELYGELLSFLSAITETETRDQTAKESQMISENPQSGRLKTKKHCFPSKVSEELPIPRLWSL